MRIECREVGVREVWWDWGLENILFGVGLFLGEVIKEGLCLSLGWGWVEILEFGKGEIFK